LKPVKVILRRVRGKRENNYCYAIVGDWRHDGLRPTQNKG
jgi:hypothetical protein